MQYIVDGFCCSLRLSSPINLITHCSLCVLQAAGCGEQCRSPCAVLEHGWCCVRRVSQQPVSWGKAGVSVINWITSCGEWLSNVLKEPFQSSVEPWQLQRSKINYSIISLNYSKYLGFDLIWLIQMWFFFCLFLYILSAVTMFSIACVTPHTGERGAIQRIQPSHIISKCTVSIIPA